jgi:hypothetical protein
MNMIYKNDLNEQGIVFRIYKRNQEILYELDSELDAW